MFSFANTYSSGNNDDNSNGRLSKLPIQWYKPFGSLAETMRRQGWHPETEPKDYTQPIVYKSNYDKAFNNVVIPNQKDYGHIALIGNPNGQFDIVIRRANGDTEHTLFKNMSANDVQKWVTKNSGLVDERKNNVAANSQPQSNLIVSNQLPMGVNGQ